jgi:hypothetical protein
VAALSIDIYPVLIESNAYCPILVVGIDSIIFGKVAIELWIEILRFIILGWT